MSSFRSVQEAGTCFLLDLGVSADLGDLKQNKTTFKDHPEQCKAYILPHVKPI